MTPRRPDAALRQHLSAITQALRLLRRRRGVTVAELEENAELRWVVERGLQLCAQNALDAATHIAASRGIDVPDYASAIDRLADLGVLATPFAREFRQVAGLRDVLVHGYLVVDLEILRRILDERLDDFDRFVADVEAALDADDA